MDIISFNEAATANGRIENFIENPDSTSGIVTVPKVIASGETVTIPAGRIAVLPNLQIDGELNIEGEVFVPSGSTLDFSNGIKVNGENIVMSVPTAYHIYNGGVSIDNTVITNGFSTTLYTGNGTTQTVNTGVDMTTQWGNDTSENFGGLVWLKSRSSGSTPYIGDNLLMDTVRGYNKILLSNATASEATNATVLTSFNTNGFSLGSNTSSNYNTHNFVSWNFQTTHRKTGTTNHGKAYTEHYNPYTGFTIIKYEGSGLAGHEIPHSLGRKLGFVTVKNLSNSTYWQGTYNGINRIYFNVTNEQSGADGYAPTLNTNSISMLGNAGTLVEVNGSTNQHIMYGWANSYYDVDNTLIGNYEVGIYQGTGVAGNKITTRGKPAWIMLKRLDSTASYITIDNIRGDNELYPNLTNVEASFDRINIVVDGFVLSNGDVNSNVSGGQYLYMVVYDNDSGSGKSKYPKATDTTNLSINALVPYANGIDVNGSKVSISYKNETISGLTLIQGKNYPYSKNDGTYDSKTIAPNYGITNPLTGDFFNLKTLKWYDNTNVEITPRTYLDCIVYADHNGQVEYIEELSKIEYVDKIKANEYQGKNACTAWVNFDGTTTPPTIRDSYNVASVVKVGTGQWDIYFKEVMDNNNYSTNINGEHLADYSRYNVSNTKQTHYKVQVLAIYSASLVINSPVVNVQIFGGKNV